jgi:hypothetical protein
MCNLQKEIEQKSLFGRFFELYRKLFKNKGGKQGFLQKNKLKTILLVG